jgi:hypothetical protein
MRGLASIAIDQKHTAAVQHVFASGVMRPFVLEAAAREPDPFHAAAIEELERVLTYA